MKNPSVLLATIVTSLLLQSTAYAGMKLVVLKRGDIKESSLNEVSRELTFSARDKSPNGMAPFWKQSGSGLVCVSASRESHPATCTVNLTVKSVLQVNDLQLDVKFLGQESRWGWRSWTKEDTKPFTMTSKDIEDTRKMEFLDETKEHLDLVYDVNAGTVFETYTEGRCVKQIRVYIDTATQKVVKWETVLVAASRH